MKIFYHFPKRWHGLATPDFPFAQIVMSNSNIIWPATHGNLRPFFFLSGRGQGGLNLPLPVPFKGPLQYLFRPLLGKNEFAVTQHMYAFIGPNLDTIH